MEMTTAEKARKAVLITYIAIEQGYPIRPKSIAKMMAAGAALPSMKDPLQKEDIEKLEEQFMKIINGEYAEQKPDPAALRALDILKTLQIEGRIFPIDLGIVFQKPGIKSKFPNWDSLQKLSLAIGKVVAAEEKTGGKYADPDIYNAVSTTLKEMKRQQKVESERSATKMLSHGEKSKETFKQKISNFFRL